MVGPSAGNDLSPAKVVSARVPGGAQLDWAAAHGFPDWTVDQNARVFDGLEDSFWHYQARLAFPPPPPHSSAILVCGGCDYGAQVRINGDKRQEFQGMFSGWEVPLRATDEDICIIIPPAPKASGAPPDRTQASHSGKPAMSYGWDFHPRLIPLGIWKPTFVEYRPACHLIECTASVTVRKGSAVISMPCRVANPAEGITLRWTLQSPNGDVMVRQIADAAPEAQFEHVIADPDLWWTHDLGPSPLYTSLVELLGSDGSVLDRGVQRFGVRTLRLVMADGQWERPETFPKTRSEPPVTIELNGRRIFAKGSNYISPEVFPGTISRDRHTELLRMAREAHFNFLRCWGGAPVPSEDFYDLCDEMGLLVWTEFPLACNNYPDDPAYLDLLATEAAAILHQVKGHPSSAILCGGNELFNRWSGMTDQSLALRLLDSLSLQLAPETPFLKTAPLMGMGHGFYGLIDSDGRDVCAIFTDAACTAYTEFGVPGPNHLEELRRIIPQEELFPPQGRAWEFHHGLGAWDISPDTWLGTSSVAAFYGREPKAIGELVCWGQLLQAQAYKHLFEEARRQWPRCSMALNWSFNEPWPCAANNSLVAYPAAAKPALHAVADSCRPILLSAKTQAMRLRAGSAADFEIWLLNEGGASLDGFDTDVRLKVSEDEIALGTWLVPGSRSSLRGPTFRTVLPAELQGTIELFLRCPRHPEWESSYVFWVLPPFSECRAAGLNL